MIISGANDPKSHNFLNDAVFYLEDFDFSLRLREIGYEQSITEDVFIYHQGSATFKISNHIKDLMKRNKRIMLDKFKRVHFHHARWCNHQLLKITFVKSTLIRSH